MPETRELTYAEALREGLQQVMEKDDSVFLIGEDVGVYGGAFGVSAGLVDVFGEERIRDTPISEAAIAGAVLGASLTGMRPVGEIQFMDFVALSMEQLVLQAAKVRYMFGGKARRALRAPHASRIRHWSRCPAQRVARKLVRPRTGLEGRHALQCIRRKGFAPGSDL